MSVGSVGEPVRATPCPAPAPAAALDPTLEALLAYAGVVRDDRVVVVHDPRVPVEPALLDALVAAVRTRGARVGVVESPPFAPRTEDVPASLAAALADADVAFDLADHESFVHTTTGRRRVREGTLRFVGATLHALTDLTAPFARFPLERLFARARAAATRLAPGGPARLTTPQGTDLAFDVRPGSVLGMPGGANPEPMRRGRGDFGLFPAGAIGTSPVGARGVVVVDGLVGVRGALAEPLRLEVEDGHVRRVSGGPEARWLAARLASHPDAGFLGKLIVGLHPHAPLEEGLAELDRRKARLSRREGVVLLGLGDARGVGGTVAAPWHGDAVVLGPVDLTVGDRPLFRAGTLQALPETASLTPPPVGPHRPRLVAAAGELAVFAVDARGPMPHAHRNPESDEVWLVLDGGAVRAEVEGHALPLFPRVLALVPRGTSHVAHGGPSGATLLVVERLPSVARSRPADVTTPAETPRTVDLAPWFAAYTPPWSRGARTVLTAEGFVVEVHARPEGMLRPDATTTAPEVWLVLRGAIGLEEGEAAPSVHAAAGHALSVPAGLACRVVSTARDTVALRFRPA